MYQSEGTLLLFTARCYLVNEVNRCFIILDVIYLLRENAGPDDVISLVDTDGTINFDTL